MKQFAVIIGQCKHANTIGFCSMDVSPESLLEFVGRREFVYLVKLTAEEIALGRGSASVCSECVAEEEQRDGCTFVADPEGMVGACHKVCDAGSEFCPRHTMLVDLRGMEKAQKHERIEARLREREAAAAAEEAVR